MDNIINFVTKKEVLGTVITLVLAYALYCAFKIIIEKVLAKSKNEFDRKRKRTVIELLKNIFKWLMMAIALIIILDLFGMDVTSLLASLGIASAVGALALQDTLKDIISGTSIIMDNYFVVGDYVKYGDFQGQVIEFGLRSTKIMDFDGRVLIVANRNISEVINLSQKTASMYIPVPTPYECKIEKVDKILNGIVEEIKEWQTVKKETFYMGIVELRDSYIEYGIRIYCSPGVIWSYKRNILRMIKEQYDKAKIKIPTNLLTVEVRNEK